MTVLFLVLVVVVFFLLIEVPVGFAFGIGALLYGCPSGTDISFHAGFGYAQVSAFFLLAIPLFILSGTLMGASGISDRLLISLLLLLMGMIIDDVSGSVLAAIILSPVTQGIGLDPIHFAGIVDVNLGLGNISPPCAPLLYMAGVFARQPLSEYIGPTMKFLLLGHGPMVLLVTFIPELSLWLPGLLG